MTGDASHFPIGAALTLAELTADPYPAYARLRADEPVSWVPAIGMWLVTRYADVRGVVSDAANFTTDSPHSAIRDAFGPQMLSIDGPDHDRFKAAFQPAFTPSRVRSDAEPMIRRIAAALVDRLRGMDVADLRRDFAARLPVLVMLDLFGLPGDAEAMLRQCYDSFERALAAQGGDPAVAAAARGDAARMRALFAAGGAGRAIAEGLGRDEIDHNLLVIFFGGISTVEALLLNTLLQLLQRPDLMTAVRHDATRLPATIEETMRWSGPVQSATRHAVRDTEIAGVAIGAGDTVNCILASANRDGAMFAAPDDFDPGRSDLKRHLGFALGSHHCLGSHLARAEVRIAIETLLAAFPALAIEGTAPAMEGHEFRQPRRLSCWLGSPSVLA